MFSFVILLGVSISSCCQKPTVSSLQEESGAGRTSVGRTNGSNQEEASLDNSIQKREEQREREK